MPTFISVLQCAREKGLTVNPELKAAPGSPFTTARAAAHVAVVQAKSMTSRTVVSSFEPTILAMVRAQKVAGLRFALTTDSRGAVSPEATREQGTNSCRATPP